MSVVPAASDLTLWLTTGANFSCKLITKIGNYVLFYSVNVWIVPELQQSTITSFNEVQLAIEEAWLERLALSLELVSIILSLNSSTSEPDSPSGTSRANCKSPINNNIELYNISMLMSPYPWIFPELYLEQHLYQLNAKAHG